MKMNNELISKYLDEVIPKPWCELEFHNDYELLIAIVLSAQTTDKRVNTVTRVLFDRYTTIEAVSRVEISEIEEMLRPLGTYKKKAIYVSKIAKILSEQYNGIVPNDRKLLEQLPGVGIKTASVFLCEYYNYPEFAVDTHVYRVSKRLGLANKNDDVLKVESKLKKFFPKNEWGKRHKQIVLFGRYYCKAIKPECKNCKLKSICKKNKV